MASSKPSSSSSPAADGWEPAAAPPSWLELFPKTDASSAIGNSPSAHTASALASATVTNMLTAPSDAAIGGSSSEPPVIGSGCSSAATLAGPSMSTAAERAFCFERFWSEFFATTNGSSASATAPSASNTSAPSCTTTGTNACTTPSAAAVGESSSSSIEPPVIGSGCSSAAALAGPSMSTAAERAFCFERFWLEFFATMNGSSASATAPSASNTSAPSCTTTGTNACTTPSAAAVGETSSSSSQHHYGDCLCQLTGVNACLVLSTNLAPCFSSTSKVWLTRFWEEEEPQDSDLDVTEDDDSDRDWEQDDIVMRAAESVLDDAFKDDQ